MPNHDSTRFRRVTRLGAAGLAIVILALMTSGHPSGQVATVANAVHFDGTNDYVTFGAATGATGLGATNFTIELWFKREGTGVALSTGTGGIASAVPLVAKGRGEADAGTNVDFNYFLGINTATNTLAVDFEEGAGQTSPSLNHPANGSTVIQLNTWYHAAATYDSTNGALRLYVNGIEETGGVAPAAPLALGATHAPRSDSIQHASIGSALNSTGVAAGFFLGTTDEVRIWNVVRTPAQILANKNVELTSGTGLIGRWSLNEGGGTGALNSVTGRPTGKLTGGPTWVIGGIPTDAAAPAAPQNLLANIGNGRVTLSWNENAELDLAGYNVYRNGSGTPLNGAPLTIPIFTDATVTNGLSYTYAVKAVDTLSNISPLSSDVIATPTSFAGAGMQFNGTNQFVTFGQAAGVTALGASQFTLETWFKRTGFGVATTTGTGGITDAIPLITKGMAEVETPANLNMNYFLGISASSGRLVADFEDTNNGLNHPITGSTPIPINANVWHHVAATYEIVAGTGTWRLYLDGALDNTLVVGAFTPEATSVQHAAIATALNSSGTTGTNPQGLFNGILDEVRIWNVALSQLEIQQGMNQEIPTAPGLIGRWGLNEITGTTVANTARMFDGTAMGSPARVAGYGFPPDLTPPAAPQNLVAIAGTSQVSLTWTVSPEGDVAGYNVFRRTASTSFGAPLNGGTLVPSPAYLDTAVVNGTEYFYAVNAVDVSTNPSGLSSEANATPTSANTPPIVNAGMDQSITLSSFAELGGSASDSGPFTVQWAEMSGPGMVNFADANAASTTATFTQVGSYTLRLTADDGEFAPFDEVTVTVTDPVLVGAGDIAPNCTTGASLANAEATAVLLDGIPGTIFTLGDNSYVDGTAAQFANCYGPTWGRHKDRTRPTTGNHDYHSADATPYFDFFNGTGVATGQAGTRPDGYYSYNLGNWHIVVLNSECTSDGTSNWNLNGCAVGSPQEQWLRADLAASPTNNIIAMWHRPYYSSGGAPSGHAFLQPLWQALYDNGVDVILGGHWHNYERLAPMNGAGLSDPTFGIRSFVIGTGGVGFAGFGTVLPTSEVRNNTTFGVMKFTLHDNSYDWQFMPIAGQTFTDSGTSAVHGAPPNNPPTADAQSASTTEDVALGITLTGSDPEGTALTFTPGTPAHGTLTGTGAARTYTPAADYNGPDSFTFTVSDGPNTSAPATVTITVNPVNDAPTANAQSVSTNEDVALDITLTGSDPEGTALTFTPGTPAHGTLTGTGATRTYTPAANYNGPDSFTFTASDGGLTSPPATVTITVNPVNDAPTADAQSVSTNEDTALDITLTGSDPEGTALTFTPGTALHGTLTGTGATRTYTPTANYNGPDSFTFTASDGVNTGPPATVSITVVPVDDAPTADVQSVSTDEDVALGITLTGSDPEGTALTFTPGTPAHGTLTGTGATRTYTPAANYNGPDSFTFTVSDGLNISTPATVTITVNPVDDVPTANAQSVSTTQDVALGITLTGSDPEGTALTFTPGTPAHGTLTGTGAAQTYTPESGYTGPDSFTFTVSDGVNTSAPATVSIAVVPPNNDPPTASAQSVSTNEDVALDITLTGSDPEGTALTFTPGTASHGTLTGTGATRTYTPAANYNGPDSFTFTVSDGLNISTPATVTITVNPVNDAPTADAQIVSTTEDVALGITLTGNDPEGSALTFTPGTPAHGTLTGTGATRTYTPAANYNGPDSFTFTVSDDSLTSAPATVSITVVAVDDAPTADAQSVLTNEDVALGITLTGNDPEGAALTFTPGTPAHGTLTGTGATRTYTPAANYNGPDSFTFTASDGVNTGAPATVLITVNPVNDAPTANAQSVSTIEGVALGITLTGSDPEGTVLTFTPGTPSHGTLTGTGATRTYTPAAGYSGPDSFTFTVNDGSLTSPGATVSITVTPLPPVPNTAIDFGGTNAYVTFGPAPGLGVSTMTIEAWFRRDGAGATTSTGTGGVTATPIVAKGRAENDGSTVDMNYFLGIDATGRLVADFEDSATGLNHPVTGLRTIPISATVWHHVAATYEIVAGTGTWRLYLDGTIDNTLPVGAFTPRSDSIQHASIGSALTSTGAAAGFFDGVIDEVRIWDRALSEAEIQTNINQQIATTTVSNLVARWGLNEDGGTAVNDSTASPVNGTVMGSIGSTWTWTAGAPFNLVITAPDPVLVGAGDIAADCVAGASTANAQATATLLDSISGTIFTLGDNSYVDGTAAQFANCYDPTWGRHKARTRPTTGNHDYHSANATPYYDYFNGAGNQTGQAGDRAGGYYSYNLGNWHIVVLNSECTTDGTSNWNLNGCVVGSAQEQWLRADSAASPTNNIIAMWHRPFYSSTSAASTHAFLLPLMQALYDGGTDIILGGHWHNYERLAPMNAAGASDPTFGIRSFVVGTGGVGVTGFGTVIPTSEVRNATTFGVMKFTLHDNSYDWQFIPIAGQTFTDSGTSAVHGPPGVGNGAPTANPQTVSTNEDTALGITLTGSDPEGTALTFTPATPLHGTLTGTGAARTYTPAANYNGPDSFTFTVSDGSLTSAPATVSITVNPVNDAPTANAQSVSTLQNVALGITLTGSDPEGAALTFTPGTALHGTLTGTGAARTYTPTAGYTGPDSFTFTVSDGTLTSAPATVSITVNPLPFTFRGVGAHFPTVDNTNQGTGPGPVAVTPPASMQLGDLYALVAAYQGTATLTLAATGGQTWTTEANAQANGETVRVFWTQFNGTWVGNPSVTNTTGAETLTVYSLATALAAGTHPEIDVAFASGAHTGGTVTVPTFTTNTAGALALVGWVSGDNNVWSAAPAGWSSPGGQTQWRNLAGIDNSISLAYQAMPTAGATGAIARTQSGEGPDNGLYFRLAFKAVSDAPPPAPDPVLVGAGDIAADCVAGASTANAEATAVLLDGIPGTIFTLGDNSYVDGTAAQFANCYGPTWGRHKARTRPVNGNHDYHTANASAYYDYFNGVGVATGPAGTRPDGYYSYNLGNWHIVVLNSECTTDGTSNWNLNGCAVGSPQEQWLRADLAASPTNNIIAMWHRPYYSSGGAPSGHAFLQPLWQALYDGGVDIWLGGHWHNYERLAPMNATGGSDPAFGIRSFVIGTGGVGFAGFGTILPTSEVRNNTTFGVMKFTLHDNSYDWQFIPIAGQTFTDSGTGTVHGRPGVVNNPPTATAQSVSTNEDVALGITLTGSDPEGAALTFTPGTALHGTLTGTGAARTYTPAANYNGPDSFTFTVSDGVNTSAPATVTITVNPVNDAPTANAQSVSTLQNVALGITLTGSDPEGTALTFTPGTALHGTLTGTGAARTYTPTAGYTGPDSFTFTVSDGTLTSAPATVSITVNPVGVIPFVFGAVGSHFPTVENANQGTGPGPYAVTPPASLQTGDLYVIVASYRGTATLSLAATGGQTWTSEANAQANGQTVRLFWTRFNGSWAGNPSVTNTAGAETLTLYSFGVALSAGTQPAIDVAFASAAHAGGTVTVPSFNTNTNNALAIVGWVSGDNNAWGAAPAGWSSPGGQTQWRNVAGTDNSISLAYQVVPNAGATGAIARTQSTEGPTTGLYFTIAFKAVNSAPPSSVPADPTNLQASPPPIVGRVTLTWADNSNNEDGFTIERCLGAGCTTFAPLTPVGPNVTTYQDNTVASPATYRYQVRAFNALGPSVNYTNAVEATTPTPPPPPPTPFTFRGVGTHFPTVENTNQGTGPGPGAVTPPASLQLGDLYVVVATYRGTATLNLLETGGQAWTAEANTEANGQTARVFWCQFNGSWTANPSVTNTAGAEALTVYSFGVGMAVGAHPEIDVAFGSGSHGGGTVTVPSFTTTTAGALAVVGWVSGDNNVWSAPPAGWSSPGAQTQWRNIAGSDSSISLAYQVNATAGATGPIARTQTSDGPTTGLYFTLAWKQVMP